LVEADARSARDLEVNVTALGYEVAAIASNGKEAVRQTSKLLPDLILMDVTLASPVSGFNAASVIWQTHSIPIIFLTDYSDIESIDGATPAKPFAYLSKPCDPAKLGTLIDRAICCRESQQACRMGGGEEKRVRGGMGPGNERRRQPRYRTAGRAMAVADQTSGRIENISMGGICFVCSDSLTARQGDGSIAIMDGVNDFFLEAIPCRVVARKRLDSESSFSMLWKVRYSMEFGALTELQQTCLQAYINQQAESLPAS